MSRRCRSSQAQSAESPQPSSVPGGPCGAWPESPSEACLPAICRPAARCLARPGLGTTMFAAAVISSFATAGFVALGMAGVIAPAGAFFGAGGTFLIAGLFACAYFYRTSSRGHVRGRGWWSVSRLGLRSTRYRPGRSVLSIGVVASATFILIAVDAFRKIRWPRATRRRARAGTSSSSSRCSPSCTTRRRRVADKR